MLILGHQIQEYRYFIDFGYLNIFSNVLQFLGYKVLLLLLILFLNIVYISPPFLTTSLLSPGWPLDVVDNDLDILILLLPPPKCWDCRCTPAIPSFMQFWGQNPDTVYAKQAFWQLHPSQPV